MRINENAVICGDEKKITMTMDDALRLQNELTKMLPDNVVIVSHVNDEVQNGYKVELYKRKRR